MPDLSLEEELDTLHALPLGEFIGARNDLAKRLKATGDGEAAAQVKALAKPSVTAWAANALYHRERALFDELLGAAAALRAALGGKGDRRQAEAAKRQALKVLLGRAARILAAAGHAATPANRQRISHTLETLAARDPAADGPRPGRLAADLEPQGFDVLAGLAASLAPPPAVTGKPGRGTGRKTAGKTAKKAAGEPKKAARKTSTKPGKASKAAAKAAAIREERLEAARRKLAEEEAELGRLEQEAQETAAAAAAAIERHERLAEEAAEATRRAAVARKAAAAAKGDLASAKAIAAKAKAARRRGLSRVATARRRANNSAPPLVKRVR